jgi:isochorismate hydrolase
MITQKISAAKIENACTKTRVLLNIKKYFQKYFQKLYDENQCQAMMLVINLNKPSQNEKGIDFHHTVKIPALFRA